MNRHWRKLRLLCGHVVVAMLVALTSLPQDAHAADGYLEKYEALKAIAYFGSVSASLYTSESGASDIDPQLSVEELTRYLIRQVATHFPDIPYRNAGVPEQADPAKAQSMGYLSCRVWVDAGITPAVFQVRCQVSTAANPKIIEDASFGYGPKDAVSASVRSQIEHIVQGFAALLFRIRSDSWRHGPNPPVAVTPGLREPASSDWTAGDGWRRAIPGEA